MKTALIIVSIIGGLALVTLAIIGVKHYKLTKKLKDNKQLYEMYLATLPTYASNADALEAGLTPGMNYKTPGNEVKTVTAAAAA